MPDTLPRVKATPQKRRERVTLTLATLGLVVGATGAPWFALVGLGATLWLWVIALHIAEGGPRPRYRRKGIPE
jgi:hypothetical protein